jgi:hypothetical protein
MELIDLGGQPSLLRVTSLPTVWTFKAFTQIRRTGAFVPASGSASEWRLLVRRAAKPPPKICRTAKSEHLVEIPDLIIFCPKRMRDYTFAKSSLGRMWYSNLPKAR